MVTALPAGIMAGALLGWLLDRTFGLGGTLTLIGSITGFFASLAQIIRYLPKPPDDASHHPPS